MTTPSAPRLRIQDISDMEWTRTASVVSAEVGGEVVALDADKGVCFGMNPIAARIWQLVERPITVEQLCALLTAEFEVAPDICERQTLDFLNSLLVEGLVLARPVAGRDAGA